MSAALHHQVRWTGFSLKQRAWLNITNQRRAYEEQPLLLYTLASDSGVLPAGAQLQLPAFASHGVDSCLSDGPCGLLFPPAIVLCSARGSASKPHPAAAPASATGLTAADGCGSLPRGFQLLEYASYNLASCSLEDVCLLLEEGLLDASSLDQTAADALLHRCANNKLVEGVGRWRYWVGGWLRVLGGGTVEGLGAGRHTNQGWIQRPDVVVAMV
jgi:hypothetical protein